MHQSEDVLASEIGSRPESDDCEDYYRDYHAYVDRLVAQTLREEQKISQNKSGSWQNFAGTPGAETFCKKVNNFALLLKRVYLFMVLFFRKGTQRLFFYIFELSTF